MYDQFATRDPRRKPSTRWRRRVRCALGPIHVADAGSALFCGTGSNVHRSAPVRASNPRTSPLAASIRLLSATAEPTTTTPSTTVGGEVSSYSEANAGAFLNPFAQIHCSAASPKSAHGDPVAASSAMSRVSIVATKIRSEQREPAGGGVVRPKALRRDWRNRRTASCGRSADQRPSAARR